MMTQEEAINALCLERGIEINGNAVRVAEFLQGLDVALSALRPVNREQVEKVWRGEWDSNGTRDIVVYCKQCMMPQDINTNFCHSCGAAMTVEAMDMVMERMEKLHETT